VSKHNHRKEGKLGTDEGFFVQVPDAAPRIVEGVQKVGIVAVGSWTQLFP